MCLTNNYNAITAYCSVPSLTDGSSFIVKDYLGYMSTTSINLQVTNPMTIDGVSNVTINTNASIKKYCYYQIRNNVMSIA